MIDWQPFTELLRALTAAKAALGLRPHQECFYRGHASITYRLQPSLYRQTTPQTDEEFLKFERRMFFDFQAKARLLYQNNHSDWDTLFHMQHHGVPTRLLDWTTVCGVAIYFALLNRQPTDQRTPCIWLLNPYALNYQTWKYYRLFSPKWLARDESRRVSHDYGDLLLDPRLCEWTTPLAIYGPQQSERMFAQSGWFTIHGTDRRSIDDVFGTDPSILQRVAIPPEAVPAAKEFLNLSGIGHRQVFPDLDGLARSVCDQFGVHR